MAATRREFLRGAGAALAAGGTLLRPPSHPARARDGDSGGEPPQPIAAAGQSVAA